MQTGSSVLCTPRSPCSAHTERAALTLDASALLCPLLAAGGRKPSLPCYKQGKGAPVPNTAWSSCLLWVGSAPLCPALLCAELLLGALCPYLQGHPTCWHQHHFHKLQHQEGAWLIASVPLWSPRTPATWPAQSFKSSEILTRNILTRSWSIPAFSHLFRCQYSTQNCT